VGQNITGKILFFSQFGRL